jgi:tripartite-type tricarboxylate transporter receptor subunit TctC
MQILRALLLICTLGAVASPALADPWPTRPIRFIVPSAPAGGIDIIARLLAAKLTIALGESVVVENRAGAGGIIGTEQVAKAAPDGYTMLAGFVGPIAINPQLYKKLPYNVERDFVPVSLIGNAYNVLVVNSEIPVTNVTELIAYAKTHRMAFGSTGIGATDHLAGELFNSLTGLSMTHVPYKGGAPAMLDLMSGQIQVIFATVSTAAGAIARGKIRPLAMTGDSRFKSMPTIPTIAESGVPAFKVNNWYGVLLPAGTPPDIVNRLNTELHKGLQSQDVQAKLLEAGIEPATDTPAEFGAYIKSESLKWKKVVKDANVVVEE